VSRARPQAASGHGSIVALMVKRPGQPALHPGKRTGHRVINQPSRHYAEALPACPVTRFPNTYEVIASALTPRPGYSGPGHIPQTM
jgi:hypothetical protein